MNVLKHHGVIGGTIDRTAEEAGTFIGNAAFPILATAGGFNEHLVKLNDKVTAGQKVILQRNAFGEVVAEYVMPSTVKLAPSAATRVSEPGNVLMFILFRQQPMPSDEDYPE